MNTIRGAALAGLLLAVGICLMAGSLMAAVPMPIQHQHQLAFVPDDPMPECDPGACKEDGPDPGGGAGPAPDCSLTPPYSCFAALPGEVARQHSAPWLLLALAGLGLVGVTGTVTYRCPAVVAGLTTAPTAGQVTNLVVADVAMGDAATITTVTHNLSGVSTNGADGSPMYDISTLVSGATPVGQGVTVAFTTNALQLSNLTTAAGNGGTYRVKMWRHSIISNFTK